MTKKLQIFTTGREGDIDVLIESALEFGVPIAVYAARWTTYVQVKLREGLEFAKGLDAEVLMWLDGNDSLVLAPESKILRWWEILGNISGAKFIMAAESNCWPDQEMSKYFPELVPGIPRFPNAGGFIGPKNQVLSAMEGAIKWAVDGDDQRAWTKWFAYPLNKVPATLDYEQRIFSSVGDGPDALQADSCTKHWNGRIPGRVEYWSRVTRARRDLEVEG